MIKIHIAEHLPAAVKAAFTTDIVDNVMYFTLQHNIFLPSRTIFYLNYCVAAPLDQVHLTEKLKWSATVADKSISAVLVNQLREQIIISVQEASGLIFNPTLNLLRKLPDHKLYSIRVIHSVNSDNFSKQQVDHISNLPVAPFVISVDIGRSSAPIVTYSINPNTGVYSLSL